MAKYLLDTNILLWMANAPERLKPKVFDLLQEEQNEIYVSVASTWEITIKSSLGKLKLPIESERFIPSIIDKLKLKVLNIELDHSMFVSRFEKHHQDPFDHMLVAQAIFEEMPIITSDAKLSKYAAKVILN